MKKIVKKTVVKKAQNGTKVDKTAVKKVNATKIMKGDNEASVRIQKNKARVADYTAGLDVAAAYQYGDERGTLLKDARKQDSISTSSKKKADSLQRNPRFKVPGAKLKKK